MNRLKQFGSSVRGSFWFLPTLIVALSIALAVGLVEADSFGKRDWMADWPRLFGAGAAGARGMLATIAGSMMTVVGVTLSMTLMTLASCACYGPCARPGLAPRRRPGPWKGSRRWGEHPMAPERSYALPSNREL
jgi:uncharacterized membrane protein